MILFRTSGLLIALAIILFAGWLNYSELSVAYGSGPPFFGRTVNMDKWHDPLPGLLVIDALCLLVGAAAVQLYRKRQAERAAVEAIFDE
jgi:multisubunit Na+/H+ antiporter MnhC subunit